MLRVGKEFLYIHLQEINTNFKGCSVPLITTQLKSHSEILFQMFQDVVKTEKKCWNGSKKRKKPQPVVRLSGPKKDVNNVNSREMNICLYTTIRECLLIN